VLFKENSGLHLYKYMNSSKWRTEARLECFKRRSPVSLALDIKSFYCHVNKIEVAQLVALST
jgi:hypothetical protein